MKLYLEETIGKNEIYEMTFIEENRVGNKYECKFLTEYGKYRENINWEDAESYICIPVKEFKKD